MKYFIQNSTGLTIGVPENTKVGEGKHALGVLEQYELYPEHYTPCTKDGKPLKVEADGEGEAKAKKATKKADGEGEAK